MDTQSFDTLAVRLATGTSRRQLFRGLIGGFMGLAAMRASAGRTLAQTCAGIQESCAEIDCCFGYGCNENTICIAAAECADFGEGCLTDEQCCSDLVCDESGACANPTADSDGNGGTAATELPGTGVGAVPSSTNWLAGIAAAAAAAGAALIGGSRLRAQPVRQPTSERINHRQDGVS